VYRPVLSRQKAVTQAVGDMLDRFFGGSADSLVLSLVEAKQLTPEKLARIQKMVAEGEEGNHGNR
jgi:predicted transcriptional regulator